jgi:AcrR family transcriptional regulator
MTTSRSPSRRVDAERNRDRILAAARTAFAEPGAGISMAEISRRADVGMATLYRNFPGRRELLEALYTDEVNAICEAATTIDAATPDAMFTAWLHRLFAFFTSKHHIASELLKDSAGSSPVFGKSRARVVTAAQPLFVAAQRAREIRSDLTVEQVLDMVAAVASIHGGTGYVEPILQATLDGLRPPIDVEPTPAGVLSRGS